MVSVGFSLSLRQDPIRSTRVLAGMAVIGLESLS